MSKTRNNKKVSFKKLLSPLLLVIVILSVIGFGFFKLTDSIKFGLDLKGGFEILYQVNSIDGSEVTSDMVTNTYKTISKRIDSLGVSEPNISIEGTDRIRVQLAGVSDSETARKTLSQVASLTFRDTKDNLIMSSDVLISGEAYYQFYNMKHEVVLKIKNIDTFFTETEKIRKSETPIMVIWLDYDLMTDSYSKNKCVNDSHCLSAARIDNQLTGSLVTISGNFTEEQAKELVQLINSGSLSTKLTEISSKTVDASFGANSLDKTVYASIIGLTLVAILMILLYRFAGFISSIGLLVYTFLTLFIFWLVGGVLTLPGIAAMLLGIGMAVDANIISFSCIKEELKKESSLQEAIKKGNKSSLGTIIDANVTTLIVGIILFILGESSIKGFATMLIISIFVTVLVMLFFTRFLLKKFIKTGYFDEKLNFLIGANSKSKVIEKLKSFDYIGKKFYFLSLTGIMFIIGIVFIIINGLNLSVEFKGGTSVSIKAADITEEKIQKDINSLKYDLISVETLDSKTINVVISNSLDEDAVLETEKYFEDKYEASTDIDVVSNVVKKELVKNAIKSLLYAFIGIIIYVSIRFTFNYAISALAALIHDVFFIVAIFALLKIEVSTVVIAAILSIIGYSINDTIVIFDKIRFNSKKEYNDNIKTKLQLKDLVNLSIKQTLNRNIFTSITTLIPVICLLVLGSSEIANFNIAMLIGLIAGAYSSLFLSTFIWNILEQRNVGKTKKKKWYEE